MLVPCKMPTCMARFASYVRPFELQRAKMQAARAVVTSVRTSQLQKVPHAARRRQHARTRHFRAAASSEGESAQAQEQGGGSATAAVAAAVCWFCYCRCRRFYSLMLRAQRIQSPGCKSQGLCPDEHVVMYHGHYESMLLPSQSCCFFCVACWLSFLVAQLIYALGSAHSCAAGRMFGIEALPTSWPLC